MSQQPPAAQPSSLAPTTKADRLASIDFARGMALLGILLVNAAALFGPIAALAEPTYFARQPAADRVAALGVLALCQGKFVSIFSLLFGYGLLGQLEKANAAGRSAAGFAFRRLAPLAVFGLIHALAIWYGDILFFYATMGFWLLLARRASARVLLIVGGCLVVFAVLVAAALGVLDRPEAANLSPADGQARGALELLNDALGPEAPAWVASEIAAYRDGPWSRAQGFRTIEWLFNGLVMVVFLGWLALGMFFIGGALWRVRFFAPEQERLRRRVVWVCLPIGLTIEAIAIVILWPYPPANRRAWVIGQAIQEVGVLFLPLGYLAGFALLAERLPGWLRDPVASAGRMSLTVYLLESILATALAYHWGLRLFGRFGAAVQVPLALAIWLLLVAASHLWLRNFRQGPMEWLWRRLEYGRAGTPR
jgi:uncharacterized protein